MAEESRVVVLDNEAVQGLLDLDHPKHTRVLEHLAAAREGKNKRDRARVVVPMVVRIEAGWIRRDPKAANANRIARAEDVALDTTLTDRAAMLEREEQCGVVDSVVAAVAASRTERTVVLTSDVGDLTRLVAGSPQVIIIAI